MYFGPTFIVKISSTLLCHFFHIQTSLSPNLCDLFFSLFVFMIHHHRKIQTNITKDLDNLPINYALLQLVPSLSTQNNVTEHDILPSIIRQLTPQELENYKSATRCIMELALYLKPSGNISALLSRPMQRKLVTLINCQLIEDEGRMRSLRAARSLGERTVTELILQHQNPQLLSTHLWAAVRARGCQFLGPAMQEEVLRLVLLALEDGSSLSRKVLVMYVVTKLVKAFPQASKTSIGHVVQLLYRASCFKVSKRESDSSLMTLKEEFRTYDALRREHDAQIVQIATEAGLRIAPDQWSALLYGDNNHKPHMQSIIDKQQNPSSFALSVHELLLALQRTGDPANLSRLRNDMDNLANIDSSSEPSTIPTWLECANALESVKKVVNGLIDFIQHHGNRKTQENTYLQNTSRYKVSLCRELQNNGNCARGQNCNFAHSDEELERYRAKYKKSTMRNQPLTSHGNSNSMNNNNNQMKESNNYNGPTQKVNMNHTLPFAKNNHNNNHHHHMQPDMNSTRFNNNTHKPSSYRSEHSMHQSVAVSKYDNHQYGHGTNHHLKPGNVYGSSSTSTPNLSLPLSPGQQKIYSPNTPRFSFNGNNPIYGNSNINNYPPNNYLQPVKFATHHRPPSSAPPVQQNYVGNKSVDFKNQLSPYHHGHPGAFSSPTHANYGGQYGAVKTPPNGLNGTHNNNSNNNGSPIGHYGMQQHLRQTPPTHFFPSHISQSNNDECNTSSSSSASFGGDQNKYLSWNRNDDYQPQSQNKQLKSPNNLMPKSPVTTISPQQHFNKSLNASSSPINKFEMSPNHDYSKQCATGGNIAQSNFSYQAGVGSNSGKASDDIDGMPNVWNYQNYNQQQPPPPQSLKSTYPLMSVMSNKDKFIRSDSILTSNTDDSYDNLPTNGKYGAIGLKTNDMGGANQWSGLQQTVSNNLERQITTVDLARAVHQTSAEIASNSHLNGNFLSMVDDMNVSDDLTFISLCITGNCNFCNFFSR